MNAKSEAIADQIRRLTEEEQAEVAADILVRLHGGDKATEHAWAQEASRRLDEIKSGSETFASEDVLAEARRRLQSRR